MLTTLEVKEPSALLAVMVNSAEPDFLSTRQAGQHIGAARTVPFDRMVAVTVKVIGLMEL